MTAVIAALRPDDGTDDEARFVTFLAGQLYAIAVHRCVQQGRDPVLAEAAVMLANDMLADRAAARGEGRPLVPTGGSQTERAAGGFAPIAPGRVQ